MSSCVKQNYADACEAGVNKQINLELYAMYTYLSLSYHYDRHDVALPGLAKYFKKAAMEEMGHAQKFMEFQNKRGGKVVLQDIKKPAQDDWGTALEGMKAAQTLERDVNQALLDLHKISDDNNDYQMSDYIEGQFLQEQVDAIKELGGYITQLERCGQGHGEFHFDKDLDD